MESPGGGKQQHWDDTNWLAQVQLYFSKSRWLAMPDETKTRFANQLQNYHFVRQKLMMKIPPPDFVKEAAARREKETKREERAKQRSMSEATSTSSKPDNIVDKSTKHKIGGDGDRAVKPSQEEKGGEVTPALEVKKEGEGGQILKVKKEGKGRQTQVIQKRGERSQTLEVKKEEGEAKKEGEERPRRYPKRNVPERNYYENPEPDDDEYIFCEHCQKDVLGPKCLDHGKPFRVLDSKVPATCKDRAVRSLPRGLCVRPSSIPGAGNGVFTEVPIPKHVQFGPYDGTLLKKGNNDGYCWQIRRTGKSSLSVDAQDERVSNWLRFVDCARFDYEQNLMPYQFQGKIYYKTRRLILPGEELLVWYGKQFMTDLGINMKTYFDPPPPPTKQIVKKGPGSALLCPWCKLSFSAQIFVQRHVNRKHGWQLGQMVLQRTATVVLPPSVTATSLGACFSPGEVCDSLLGKLPAGGDSLALVKKSSGKFHCPQCNIGFTGKGHLTVHLRIHTNDRPFKCTLCQYSSCYKNALDYHVRTHTGEKNFECETCGQKFSLRHHLTNHEHTHTGLKPFSCTQCDYTCTQLAHLTRHMRTHTGEKPFACTECDYKCTESGNLTRHMRSHTGEKSFACTECDYKCTESGNLTRHMRSHTGEKSFACTECDYKCTESGNLTRHMRSHTGEKPFACTECDYKCTQSNDLTRHMRTHTGEKPFACTECDYKCTTSGSLTNHMRTHTGEKPFACTECDYKCTESGTLTRHMRTHSGEKPYQCSVCQLKFTRNSNMKNHMKKLHPSN